MLDASSRYYALAASPLVHVTPGGRQVPYIPRRLLPRAAADEPSRDVTPAPGERFDQMAARVLGSPELFWRLCDANDIVNPFVHGGLVDRPLAMPSSHIGIQGQQSPDSVRSARAAALVLRAGRT